MLATILTVVLAGLLAYFYPAYAALLHSPYPMSEAEAHILSLYLVVIGIIYLLLTRPRKAPASGTKPVVPPAERPTPTKPAASPPGQVSDD